MFGLAHFGQQLSQLAPPSALLHTPPAAAPASRRRGSVACATSAVTRPAMLNGPMHSHFFSLGSNQACARSFQKSSSSPAWVSCSVWLARCANHALCRLNVENSSFTIFLTRTRGAGTPACRVPPPRDAFGSTPPPKRVSRRVSTRQARVPAPRPRTPPLTTSCQTFRSTSRRCAPAAPAFRGGAAKYRPPPEAPWLPRRPRICAAPSPSWPGAAPKDGRKPVAACCADTAASLPDTARSRGTGGWPQYLHNR